MDENSWQYAIVFAVAAICVTKIIISILKEKINADLRYDEMKHEEEMKKLKLKESGIVDVPPGYFFYKKGDKDDRKS